MDDVTHTMQGDPLPPRGSSVPLANWGPFQLREQVGQGGFGEVYRAWDPKLQREVAIKLLRSSRSASSSGNEPMLREARLTARVRHANIVSVHGVDLFEGRVGFWTDFVRGKTLAAVLAAQGPFAAREAAHIGIELCSALSAVHGAGLLHRDIKPGNVMREEGGRILLMDFGLTQQTTGAGEHGGTLQYMAPELLTGEPASVATDIYALGALLFELVTGKDPVEPATDAPRPWEAYAKGRRRSLFEERPDLPLAFARVLETAIDPDPKKRFASAGQLLVAISDAMGIGSVSATAAPIAPRRRLRWWMAVPAAAILLLMGYAIPGVRGRFQNGVAQVTGAHAEYLKAQDLLDHYYQPHNLENSIPLFQKNIEKEPKFALAWAGLGRAYWRRYQDTRDSQYIPQARDASARALELGQNLASVHVTLGMIYTDAGKNDLATQELEQAQSIDGTNAEVYGALSDLYRKEGRTKDAEEALQKAIDLDPKDWRWVNQLGLFYMYYSSPVRLNDAVVLFQKAVSLTPDNGRAYSNLGLAYKNLEKFGDARTAFEKAIQLDNDYSYFSNLGLVLQLEGDYGKAAEMFRRSLELNPTSYIAAGNLASALEWTPGAREESRKAFLAAIVLAEKYLADRPKDVRVLSTLGGFYAAVGDEGKSLQVLRKALALEPTNSQALYKAGVAYEMLHRRVEALRYIRAALSGGYPVEYIRRDPELAELRKDPKFSATASEK